MKVSIITVDYNHPEVTLQLLASLENIGLHTQTEVIVVDNGSQVNAGPAFEERYPWVKFIRSEKNLGFAGGNNLGIQQASGDYFFFINNDTELKEDIISPMLDMLDTNPDIGLLCPEIRYFDQPDVVQYSGFTPVNPLTGRNRCLTETQQQKGWFDTSFPHGAAMMIPRKVVEQVGPMPELFFLYYEEHDWAEMIRRAGYKIAVTAEAKIYHKESKSVSRIGELKMYFMTRNRLLFMRRNYPGLSLIVFWFYFLLLALPKNILELIFHRDWKNIRAFFAAVGWNISSPVNSDRLGYKFDYLKVTP